VNEAAAGSRLQAGDVSYRQASKPDIPAVRDLFVEYAASVGVDLCFQGFDKELEGLPGGYSPPGGALILAEARGELAGCIALRRIDDGTCEMKRLYVRDRYRGLGIGAALVKMVLAEASRIGYRRMRLDTLPSMQTAIRLYRSFGFHEVGPYVYNPVKGALFMEIVLPAASR
jgi:ribosomal protein S18 acetylase RimI-like enzyme